MKPLFIALFLLFSISLADAKAKIDSIGILNEKIKTLQGEQEVTRSIVEVANSSIANQLASSSNYLAISTIVISLIVLGAGVYITHVSNKVQTALLGTQSVLDEAKTIKSEVIILKESVNHTKYLIDNNVSQLYKEIIAEEIKYIFKRLERNPRDISNVFNQIATHEDLEPQYFNDLKVAFCKLVESKDYSKCDSVLILIAQHFPGKALNDEILIKEFATRNFYNGLFRHELENFANQQYEVSEIANSEFFEDIVIHVIKASLNESKACLRQILTIYSNLNTAIKVNIINKLESSLNEGLNKNLPEWREVIKS